MSNLWNLIQAYLDSTGVREAEFARRMGSSPQTLNSWKNRGLRSLPERRLLEAVAELTRVPYPAVLDAALIDIGYFGEDGNSKYHSTIEQPELIRLSFMADDAVVAARQADGYDSSDNIAEVISALDTLVDAVYDLAREAQGVAIQGVGNRDELARLKDEELKARRRRRTRLPSARSEAEGRPSIFDASAKSIGPNQAQAGNMPPWNPADQLAAFDPPDGDIDKGHGEDWDNLP